MVELGAMRVAMIGAGRVGAALGHRWAQAGHEVIYGVRDPGDPKHAALRKHADVTTVPAAAQPSDVVVIAVPWAAVELLAPQLGPMGDKVVIDATNPLAGDQRGHERDPDRSGAERLAGWLNGGRVVKAFNTTGSANMEHPVFPDGTPMMAFAGDDAEAKEIVAVLAAQLGFDPVDVGPLPAARDLEHLALMWIRLAYTLGNGPNIAFALLRR